MTSPQINYWKSVVIEPSEEELEPYKLYVCLTKKQRHDMTLEEEEKYKNIGIQLHNPHYRWTPFWATEHH